MTTHANPCGAATTWVVWANTWKNTCCGFLGILFFKFFALFFGSRRARKCGPILTIYTSYDVFPPKDVPFGGLVHTAPHFGGKIPPKTPILGAWIGIFKLNVQNIKICILSKFLHRLPSNFAQSQRPPSTLRHLEKLKNRHISAAFWAISTKFGTRTQFDPLERTNR